MRIWVNKPENLKEAKQNKTKKEAGFLRRELLSFRFLSYYFY